MVPKVKELRAELEIGSSLPAEDEVLEQRYIPIVATGAADTIMRFIAPSPRGWHRKDRSIEPLFDRMRIHHPPVDVWSVDRIGNNTRHILARQPNVQRGAGCGRNNA